MYQGTGYGAGAINNLLNTIGNASTVSVSGLGNGGATLNSAALSIFNGSRGFFAKGQDTTISITGLTPNTAYDLYIYSLSPNNAWGDTSNTERGAGDFVTTNTVNGNGQSQWLDNGIAGINGNAFVPNGNYVVFQSIVSNGSGSISILVDAYDGIIGTSGTAVGACRLPVSGLQIRPASGMSVDYMNWRNASFPGLGLPDEDDDGDGLSNDYERIFGLDPTDSASASPYVAPFDAGDGYFSYTRRTQSLANLNYKVWVSTDLEDWFEDNAATQFVESVMNGVETVGVQIDPVLFDEPKLFLQDLALNFRPPSAVAKRGGKVGNSFNATINYTREVLNNLGAEFPEWAGRGYEIVGFGWHQGYNDRVTPAASAEYKDNMPDFISDVREVFNNPNLPFAIATTGMVTGPAEPAPYPGYSAVEKAQLWVAGVPRPAKVLSSDTRPFWRDPAQSPATTGQGFHWNHNAESLFLIGKALGDDMQTLLSE